MVEQAGHRSTGEVALQRPGRVGVANRECQVRDALEHHPLVGESIGDVERFAVDHDFGATEEQQLETGCGHDHVGFEMLAATESDSRLGEPVDVIGDDRRRPILDRLEQIAVGHRAHTLVPRVVPRREVWIDVVSLGELQLHSSE